MLEELEDSFDELVEESLRRSEEISDQQECMQIIFEDALKIIKAEYDSFYDDEAKTAVEELCAQLGITKERYNSLKNGYVNTRVPLGVALGVTIIANKSYEKSALDMHMMGNSIKVSPRDEDLKKVINACIKTLSISDYRQESYLERLGRLNDILEKKLEIRDYKELNKFKTKAEIRQEKWRNG